MRSPALSQINKCVICQEAMRYDEKIKQVKEIKSLLICETGILQGPNSNPHHKD